MDSAHSIQTGLVLRDGTTANVRSTTPADAAVVDAFLTRLQAGGQPLPAVDEAQDIEVLCDTSDHANRATLLVTRRIEGEPTIIAVGAYAKRESALAAISIAVDPRWRGIGIATRLLEKLSVLAAHHGFRRFQTVAHTSDLALRETLTRSGLLARETKVGELVHFDLAVIPDEAGRARADVRDTLYTTTSLRPFFRPRAVAIVGAGRDPRGLGHRILDQLIANRFQGPVYVVNPRAKVVGSFRTYAALTDLPESVDLAILAVPKQVVPAVVEDAAKAGVRGIVVITAGFAETGPEGRAAQDALVQTVRGHGMRMVGPNCMGLLDTAPEVRLAATFAPIFPPHGRVAMLSQSGALGVAILQFAKDLDLGLSSFVSVGNKADVSGNDLLQYWSEDPQTSVILLYLESFGNPRRFARIARRVGRTKPVIAVKGGRSAAGKRAAGSHTASLAGSDAAVSALTAQTGMIRAETLEEMFHIALVLSSQPLAAGRRVAILTNAGGPAILAADALEQNGLLVEPLSTETQAALARILPDEASTQNPVDMIASAGPEQYRAAAEILLAAEEVDALIVIDVPLDEAQWDAIQPALMEGIVAGRARAAGDKPVLGCVMGAGGHTQAVRCVGSIPCFPFPEAAARVLARVTAYAEWRRGPEPQTPVFDDTDTPAARAICRKAIERQGCAPDGAEAADEGWLTPAETRDVLAAAGLPVLAGGVATSVAEARSIAREVGFPVAVKLASNTIVHKTEIGGVHLNLADEAAVEAAFRSIRERLEVEGRLDAFDGTLIQPMITGGAELLVGVVDDPAFGSLIAFGLGGIHVEVLQDVMFRVAPLTDQDAAAMVRGIRGRRLLDGYRGHPPADVPAIHDVLLRISRLVEDVLEIREMDLNPLIALAPGEGCRLVDARIRVGPPPAP